MTDLVPFDPSTKVSTVFNALNMGDMKDDLTQGVGGGFAVVSIRGGKWRLKHKGVEHPIMIPGTGDPAPSLEVVLVKANPYLTKQFYEKKFEEGDDSAPDCYSLNGETPDPQSPKLQAKSCAACPMNQFGSRITDSGKKAKRCQDSRKMAIVPVGDIKNEQFGGPMLLRVPATALKDLAAFGEQMRARGYPYNAVAVRLGFDINVAYPKPTFKAIRPLTDAEATDVVTIYQSDAVNKILADFETVAPAEEGTGVAGADPDFEIPPAKAAQAPAPAPIQVQPQPVQQPAQPAATAGVAFGAPPAQAPPAQPQAGVAFGAPTPAVTLTAAAPPPPPARKRATPPPKAAEPAGAVQVAAEGEGVVVPAAQPAGALENEINSILADLGALAT